MSYDQIVRVERSDSARFPAKEFCVRNCICACAVSVGNLITRALKLACDGA